MICLTENVYFSSDALDSQSINTETLLVPSSTNSGGNSGFHLRGGSTTIFRQDNILDHV